MSPVVAAHAVATLFMCGLIWFVQVVHYRLFDGVGDDEFSAYEERHTRLTGLVVGPPMLVEFGSAAWLVLNDDPAFGAPLAGIGFGLLVAIWALTGLVAVPAHGRLARGFDRGVHRRLMAMNLARTFLWSARGSLVVLAWL